MKKMILLLLPLLLILSCESDEEGASLVGAWNIQSVTNYEGATCVDNPDQQYFGTATVVYTDQGRASLSGDQTYSFSSYCGEIDGGEMADDTTCVLTGEFDGGYEFYSSEFPSICDALGGELNSDNECNIIWLEEFDYTYDVESGEYCETHYEFEEGLADSLTFTVCGILSVSANSATIQFIEEWADGSIECTEIILSK